MTGKRRRRGHSEKSARQAMAAGQPTGAHSTAARGADPVALGSTAVTDSVVHGTVVSGSAPGGAQVATFVPDEAVVRRTKDGWRVGGDDLPDLTCAMVLADLIAAENGIADVSPGKPTTPEAMTSEAGRLRATVGQLEHALATRIRVEQAIGVLAERHRIKPRQAFEQLRNAARSRGRKVIDIAGDVVASATNPLLQLPDELSRPRPGSRRAARQPSGAQ